MRGNDWKVKTKDMRASDWMFVICLGVLLGTAASDCVGCVAGELVRGCSGALVAREGRSP